jgi:hypothetical protein
MKQEAWSPITLFCPEIQAAISRTWNCQPAWDVSAVYTQPDKWLSLPPELMTREKNGAKHELKPLGVFWNRHIDRRFTIPYVHASRETPRMVSRNVGNPWKEWDIMIRERDRILQENGLTVKSHSRAVARALADSFACDNFEKKGHCPSYPDDPRSLSNVLDAVLYRSFCVGNAMAFMAMADSCGLKTRTIGCGAHRVAEVLVDARWHLVDSVGRHQKSRGLDCFFKSSYHDTCIDPMGDHGESLTPDFRQGLFNRPNGQYHFHDGVWGGTRTLRWSAVGAHALYPGNTCWGFKGTEEMPIIRRAGGFYPALLHNSDSKAFSWMTYQLVPDPVPDRGPSRSYLYHNFNKGQVLRESFQVDSLDGIRFLRVVFTFAWSKATDFSDSTGGKLMVRVGSHERSLAELGAWPPKDQGQDMRIVKDPSGEMLHCVADLPTNWFQPNTVNWLSLHNASDTVLHVPCIPAALEPYIPPLWTDVRCVPINVADEPISKLPLLS